MLVIPAEYPLDRNFYPPAREMRSTCRGWSSYIDPIGFMKSRRGSSGNADGGEKKKRVGGKLGLWKGQPCRRMVLRTVLGSACTYERANWLSCSGVGSVCVHTHAAPWTARIAAVKTKDGHVLEAMYTVGGVRGVGRRPSVRSTCRPGSGRVLVALAAGVMAAKYLVHHVAVGRQATCSEVLEQADAHGRCQPLGTHAFCGQRLGCSRVR